MLDIIFPIHGFTFRMKDKKRKKEKKGRKEEIQKKKERIDRKIQLYLVRRKKII